MTTIHNNCINNRCLNRDCETCPFNNVVDLKTELDIENDSAVKGIQWQFAGFLAVVSIVLIIFTNIYL
jgi:hypothetical protein